MFYFTSDVHFNDLNTIINDNRPFKTTKEFDKKIVKMWNKITDSKDIIYVVGDFIDCDGENHDSWKKSIKYVKKLKAKVVLIMGNNEDRLMKYYFDNDFNKFKEYCLSLGFKNVYKNLILRFKNQEFYLVHKPINYKEGIINLFGHVHRSGGLYYPFGLNVGCDLNHFRLLSEDDIVHLLNMKEKYWIKDKNLNMKWE